jgi:hypothetical protein
VMRVPVLIRMLPPGWCCRRYQPVGYAPRSCPTAWSHRSQLSRWGRSRIDGPLSVPGIRAAVNCGRRVRRVGICAEVPVSEQETGHDGGTPLSSWAGATLVILTAVAAIAAAVVLSGRQHELAASARRRADISSGTASLGRPPVGSDGWVATILRLGLSLHQYGRLSSRSPVICRIPCAGLYRQTAG